MNSIMDPNQLDSLGVFADPNAFNAPIEIKPKREKSELGKWLRSMIRIRYAEESIAGMVRDGLAKCPCHLGIGQEAVAVGVSNLLRKTDKVFGGHRSHAHYLALGGDLYALFAEVLGKEDGCSKGMGGSMHLYAPEVGFIGSVPIVGATIPIAVGAGLAEKLSKSTNIGVSYFGDGAAEEGVLHESLNLASHRKLPVLFVCENNLYSSHLDIKLRQPSDVVSRFATAHKIKSLVVDGNDVAAVTKAIQELCDHIRSGAGPGFLEAITYRWKGHVGAEENIDVGLRRSASDLAAWKKRDPILRLEKSLLSQNYFTQSEIEEIHSSEKSYGENAVQKAIKANYPSNQALLGTVFYTEGRA